MDVNTLLVFLIVGAVAGWLAGVIVKGHGFGLVGNIIVGIVGAFLAGWLLPMLGIAIGGGIVAAIINALIGAVILLVIIGFIRRAT
ncbi:MAG TPA: GlsB/YeaQ/YmgE family stress response membrane protein [Rhodanobacteraceae bacterium]